MTAPAQHPQRCVLSCDSCGHAEKTNSKVYPFKCLISKPVPMMVHKYCVSWFGYVGCASHTNAPAPKFVKNCMCDKYSNCTDCQSNDATIAKAAREQVLDDLEHEIVEHERYQSDPGYCDALNYVQEEITTLRSTKEP